LESRPEHHILNHKSFQDLFNSFFAPLCSFAQSYLNEKDAAEDIVQDVFIAVWKNRNKFSEFISIKSYLYKAVRNKCLNEIKHQLVVNKHVDIELSKYETEKFFAEHVIEEETHRMIKDAVNKLPEKCKEIILLSLKGMKNHEISENLEISINTVKTQKNLAYKKLRIQLKDVFTLSPFFFELFLK